MQQRHQNRQQYFNELALTCQKFFIPYIRTYCSLKEKIEVLEIGCGDGGNLLPFSRMGYRVTGVDMATCRIKQAKSFFEAENAEATFIASDIFLLKNLEHRFDLIICHDVFEHIQNKEGFLSGLNRYLKPDGIVFMAFPAWQMPFGGHQQICKNRLLSHIPFIHLLPKPFYKILIRFMGENDTCLKELMEIKENRVSVESFEHLLKKTDLQIINRKLWFINPHYETKFGLKPRSLNKPVANIPWFRNFFCTSCFYLLTKKINKSN